MSQTVAFKFICRDSQRMGDIEKIELDIFG